MKIAFIIQDLFFRGAQYATAMIANGFAAKGYDVDVLVSKIHSENLTAGKISFELDSRINLIQMQHRRARHNIVEVRKYLRKTDSVAIVAMDSNYENVLAIASLFLSHKPRIYTVEHGIRFALNRDLMPRARYGMFSIERWRRLFVYSRIHGVLTVSTSIANELFRLFKVPRRKLHVVYNPVVDDNVLKKLKYEAQHPWLKDKNIPTFIIAGQLESCKGIDIVIKAVHELNKARPVRLIVYGEGEDRPKYEQYIKENNLESVVSLPGYTSRLLSELSHSDGYICGSRIESFGITVVEALVADIPVVSVNVPLSGPVEIIEDGKFGRVVPFGDITALQIALEDICSGVLKSSGAVAWQKFTREAIVQRYEIAVSNIEILEPYKFDNIQFFRQWVADAWSKLGGSVKSDIWIPWKLKVLFDKIGLSFSLPPWIKNGRKLLVTSGGNPGFFTVPYSYRYEIIPMVWDCWEKYWPYLVRFIVRNKVRLVFCTSSQTAKYVREKVSQCNAIWIPEGINVGLYPKGESLLSRKIDVLEMGRCMSTVHEAIVERNTRTTVIRHLYQQGRSRLFPDFNSLTLGLRSARMVVCYPRCDTHPELAGRVETMTQRYWECMLSGALMIGRAPQELIDFCGYNPVISLGDNPAEQILEILSNIASYQGLVDKNREVAERLADWSCRIPLIFKNIRNLDYA